MKLVRFHQISSVTSNVEQIMSAPVLFLSHGGGPCFFMESANGPFKDIDKNSVAASFYKSLFAEYLPSKPVAIVVVSAHWEEPKVTVSCQQGKTSLIYDYYGFPAETYAPNLTYPAKTDLSLANRIYELLNLNGIPAAKADRGFDHGVFIPLKLAIPDASIPIVQVSLHSNLDPQYHISVGEALAPLRNDNILIVCSGSATHNLREIMSENSISKPYPYITRFLEWIRLLVEIDRNDASAIERSRHLISNLHTEAPDLQRVHPRTEHLVPLAVAFGAANPKSQSQREIVITPNEQSEVTFATGITNTDETTKLLGKRIYSQVVGGALALDSYIFY